MPSTPARQPAVGAPAARKPANRLSAAERRAEILDAAEAIARAQGLSAVTMRAVAARAGVAPTLVVHHIESMDHLVAIAFDRIVGAELTELEAYATSVVDPARRLDAILEAALDGTRSAVTLVWVESWALGRANAPLADRVREQMDAWRGFFARLITAGCEAGRYRAADPLAIAGQLLGMIDGLNAHSLVGWQADSDRVALMRRAADAMLGAAPSN